MSCIYKITNTSNGKVYIGQTRQPLHKRWQQHKRCAMDSNMHYTLYKAMNKYGIDKFTIECIYECQDEELDALEKKYIAEYDSYTNGYNETRGGQGIADVSKLGSVRRVKQYTYECVLLNEFESVSAASRKVNVSIQNINDCCNGKIRQANGYLWCYEGEEDTIKPLALNRVISTRMKPVKATSPDGDIKIFTSTREAAKFAMASSTTIARRCNGDITSLYRGYKYEYYNID